MTKQIRKDAPAGAEWFKFICGVCTYYKADENDQVWLYTPNNTWMIYPYAYRDGMISAHGFHSLHFPQVTPRRFWWAYLLGFSAVVSAIYWS